MSNHRPFWGVGIAAVLRSLPSIAWDFRWLVASGVFLILPAAIYELGLFGSGDGTIDKIAVFAIPASALWAIVALTVARRVWIAQLLLLPIYAIAACDLFLIAVYNTRITSSVISLILENAHHAADFVETQYDRIAAGLAAFGVCYGLLFYRTRKLVVRTRHLFALGVLGLVLLYGAVTASRIHFHKEVALGLLDVVSHDRNSPFGFVPQGYIARIVYEDASGHQERVASFRFDASRPAIAGPEIYVLVIGESSRPDRWALHGYDRPTTPRLSREPGVIWLRDLVTQVALTQWSVPLMITRNTIENHEARFDEKSIVSAFAEAGFETFWLSTQQRDQFTGAINRYSGEADHALFYERRFDGVLIDEVRRLLRERRKGGPEKLLFVLHTQGSHFVFSDRYPQELAAFVVQGEPTRRVGIEYDNSIEYTDRVLADLIQVLKESGSRAGLLYMSDHGVNLWDDQRGLFGHFFNNEYDIPTAGLVWLSDAYIGAFPEKLAAVQRNASLPLNTRVAFSSLADLGSLQIPGMDLAAFSVFSSELKPYPRMFIRAERISDYDRWRSESAQPGKVGDPNTNP